VLQDTQRSTPRARALRRPGQRLTKRLRLKYQRQFIETFGDGGIVQAMTRLGLSRFTLYAWLHDPSFAKRYAAKIASYELKPYVEPTAEEWEQTCQQLRSIPDWQLIRRMKINERMKARRGEPHSIYW
jgi:hypothetical protein